MGNTFTIRGIFDDKISSGVAKARDQFDQFGKSKGFMAVAQGVGMGVGISAWNLLQQGIGDVIGVGEHAVKLAIDQQEAMSRLTASIHGNVAAWDGRTDAIDRTTEAGIKLGFTDIEQETSLTGLVAATHDVTKATTVLAAAEDLARFKHISLQEASDALVKVEGGRFRLLAGLGIQLKAGSTAEQALAAVQKVTAGQAEAYSKTTQGAFDRLNATWEKAQEELGTALLPALTQVATFMSDTLPVAVHNTTKVFGEAVDAANALSNALNFVVGAQDDAAASSDWLGSKTDPLGKLLHWVADGFDNEGARARDAALAMAEHTGGIDLAAVAAHNAVEHEDALGTSLTEQANAAHLTTGKLADLRTEAAKVKTPFENLKTAIDRARDAINNMLPGPEELSLRLADTKLKLQDAIDHLGKLAGIKDPTRAQREDIFETKLQILGYKKDIFDTALAQAELGKAPSKALLDYLRKVEKGTGEAATRAHDLLYQLTHVAATTGGISFTVTEHIGGKQHGGPVRAGATYLVGERGPELLHMGSGGGGFVQPNTAGWSGGGGVPVVIPIMVDGQELARVMDQNLYYIKR